MMTRPAAMRFHYFFSTASIWGFSYAIMNLPRGIRRLCLAGLTSRRDIDTLYGVGGGDLILYEKAITIATLLFLNNQSICNDPVTRQVSGS
ncbi:hypothetical protein F4860DRAFT_490666 [Xylaria cubensis]|nr:hypothetical protein F4860DRAFT_490666 [Xylaria cubensis]